MGSSEPMIGTDSAAVAEHAGEGLNIGVYEDLAGVRFAMRHFLSFSEARVTNAGITSQQYQALLVVKVARDSEIRMKDLAHQMLLRPNGAVQLVDRLTIAGFVMRIPSPEDRRSVLVSLTHEGALLLEHLAQDHLREMLIHEPLLAESLARLRSLASLY